MEQFPSLGLTDEPAESEKEKEKAVGYVHTKELPQLLQQLGISIFVTTYQAQRVLVFSAPTPDKLFMLMRVFPRPTGMAFNQNKLAMCCKNQIWFFRTATDVRDEEGNVMPYDLIWVPRHSHVTGDIAAHQLQWNGDELIIVNTRFSCLSTLNPDWSFVPGWKPPFVTEYAPDDRCHLNGFCMDNNGPKYATALGETNTKEGWRENKAKGGILIDIPSGEIVARNLSMPHTPILYGGRLWLLESGTGSLLVIDEKTGQTTTVARFPGFLRGLVFYDRFAFVGLCQIREKKAFGGLPIEEMYDELKCAIHILDVKTGQVIGFIEFTKGIEELFDMQIMAGVKNPHIIGFEEETIDGLMILPPGSV